MTFTANSSEACNYCDLIAPGSISLSWSDVHGVVVQVDGFEFAGSITCREHAIKAMAWAADVLRQQVEATRLVPGGRIASMIGSSASEERVVTPLVNAYRDRLQGALFTTGQLPSSA